MTRNLLAALSSCVFLAAFAGSAAIAADKATVRILVLTGNEYPGHKWKETAPLITKFLGVDPRLKAEMNPDPMFLASPELHNYDAIVLNYLNWKCPDPGDKARANLQKFVSEGKGLVIIHNACAAFGDWEEFKEIAGRAWNPKRLRGHDPYGAFKVEITNGDHAIMKGLKPFETTDELYTCLLTSGRPVEVLAKATSVVDKKEYPMVIANHYGKGRVFLCVLGHDVKSLSVEAVQELYRRGTAWAAALPPAVP